MKIEIREVEHEEDNTISFRLVVDEIIMTPNTGLEGVCEFLMSNYMELSRASSEGNLEELKKEYVRNLNLKRGEDGKSRNK